MLRFFWEEMNLHKKKKYICNNIVTYILHAVWLLLIFDDTWPSDRKSTVAQKERLISGLCVVSPHKVPSGIRKIKLQYLLTNVKDVVYNAYTYMLYGVEQCFRQRFAFINQFGRNEKKKYIYLYTLAHRCYYYYIRERVRVIDLLCSFRVGYLRRHKAVITWVNTKGRHVAALCIFLRGPGSEARERCTDVFENDWV